MATMTKSQEQLMRRYLLGELPEAEQVALEERVFADEAHLEEVCAIENQLVDDYVRGRLTRRDHTQFETYYLSSPRHRERVDVAQMLLQAADAAQAAAPSSAWLASWWVALRGPQFAWGLALANLLLFVGLGSWLWLERTRLQAQLTALRTEQTSTQARERALAQQVATQGQQNERLANELAQLRERQTAQVHAAPQPTRPTILSFLLTASLLRGGSEPQHLTLPRGTSQIELKLRLETHAYTSYEAVLHTVEGTEVLRRRQLQARPGPNGALVALKVPTPQLPAGDYILTLSGQTTAGQTEELNRYFFRVIR
jgi:hypothetical protein